MEFAWRSNTSKFNIGLGKENHGVEKEKCRELNAKNIILMARRTTVDVRDTIRGWEGKLHSIEENVRVKRKEISK